MKKQMKKLDEAHRDKKKQQQEVDYLAFLKKRLASEHYRASVSPEEYQKTQAKYDKARLIARLLK